MGKLVKQSVTTCVAVYSTPDLLYEIAVRVDGARFYRRKGDFKRASKWSAWEFIGSGPRKGIYDEVPLVLTLEDKDFSLLYVGHFARSRIHNLPPVNTRVQLAKRIRLKSRNKIADALKHVPTPRNSRNA